MSGFKSFIKNTETSLKKHSPEILTGLGIAGMVVAGVMAVRATPKALDLLEEVHKKEEHGLTKKEVAKEILTKVAPVYIPSIAMATVSAGALIGSTSISSRRVAAWSTAYSLSENAFRTYQEKVIETIGEDKEKEVSEKVAAERISQHPIRNTELDISNGVKQIYYEPIAQKYFTMSTSDFKDCINKLNHRMVTGEMFISFADYCYEIGIAAPANGEDIGWNIDHLIEPKPGTPVIIQEDGIYQGMSCIVVDFYNKPLIDFSRLM